MIRGLLWLVAALTGLLVVSGCGFVRGNDDEPAVAAPVPSASEPENIVDPVDAGA